MSGAWENRPQTEYFIGLASTGRASLTWAITLKELIIPGDYRIATWIGLPVDIARNRLVRDAQEAGARYLFFLDDDILPPADCLAVLESNHVPIVSGLYWAKMGVPAIWRWDLNENNYLPITNWPRNNVVPIDAAGAGCLLIDMRVFDTIPPPWFKWEVDDPKKGGISEDWYFYRKARGYGFNSLCDTRVRCFHECRSELMPEGTFRPSP